MGKSHLEAVAGGGLIGRRSFLRSGFQFTMATTLTTTLPVTAMASASASASAPLGTRLPDAMRMLGGRDSGYGSPATYEQHVQRTRSPSTPETDGFVPAA